ncbi:MAG: hypothetical protein SO063_07805 [Eubacteriales bacterium]|nr:hypothetical protein [Eubacteriales bacterium]
MGEAPIIKNIDVCDASGNRYAPTYEKRARGLVKHGRARWIDDHTIELARPPENDTEDNHMEPNIKNPVSVDVNVDAGFEEKAANAAAQEEQLRQTAYDEAGEREITTRDLLDAILALMSQTDVLDRIVDTVRTMPLNESPMGGDGDKARGNALNTLAQGYSENLKYALAIVERMYRGIHPEAYEPAPSPFDPPRQNIRRGSAQSGTAQINNDIAAAIREAIRGIPRL